MATIKKNTVKHQHVAAKRLTKKALLALISTCYSSVSMALPALSDMKTVQGDITGALKGKTLEITQLKDKGIINWSNFNIADGELVKFIQNSDKAVTLNRISGGKTEISGALQANGNLFLINPQGIIFKNTAKVDVNSLMATTLDVADEDFDKGIATFRQLNAQSASILNEGKIDAKGGVYLIAPEVNNKGEIISTVASRVGTVALIGADQFDIQVDSSSLIGFKISNEKSEVNTQVSNSKDAKIVAENVYLTAAQSNELVKAVVNNEGVIEATTLVKFNASNIIQNGKINNGNEKVAEIDFNATHSIKTGRNSETKAKELRLETTQKKASIGGEFGVNDGSNTTAVQFDADIVHAKTNQGHIYLKDLDGGVKLGEVDTGVNLPEQDAVFKTSIITTTVNGGIQSDNSKIKRAWSMNLNADGDIGEEKSAVLTETSVLLANAKNGSIHIENASFTNKDEKLSLLLGKTITSEYVNDTLAQAIDDGYGNIGFFDGTKGSRNISIKTTGGMLITDTVSATNNLKLESGGSIQTQTVTTNGVSSSPVLTAAKMQIQAQGDVGLAGQQLNTNTEELNFKTTDGGVFVKEQNGLKRVDITATKDISVTAENGSVVLGQLKTEKTKKADDTTNVLETNVSITAKRDGVLGTTTNTPARNITGGALIINSASNIGVSGQYITTDADRIDINNSHSSNGSYIDNLGALKSISASVKGTDTKIKFQNNNYLEFDDETRKLMLKGGLEESLSFINTSTDEAKQDLILEGVSVGDNQSLTIESKGRINQNGNNPTIAKNLKITAGKGIGTTTALSTQAENVELESSTGHIKINNDTDRLTISAKTGGTASNIEINQTQDLKIIDAQGTGDISIITKSGTLEVDENATISGTSLVAKAKEIGSVDRKIQTQIDGSKIDLEATEGDIYLNNAGNITESFKAKASKGAISIENSGNVAFDYVESEKNVNINISGNATKSKNSLTNFTVKGEDGLTFTGASFGQADDEIIVNVPKIVIDTSAGGIYLKNENEQTLNLVKAFALGSGSNISIESKGDINLGVIEARGNEVNLKSVSGGIEDARSKTTSAANIKAKSLTIDAAKGVGKSKSLNLDVGFISANGGEGEVKASNAKAIALDESTLSGKTVSITASDIIILDNNGKPITLKQGGVLSLTATSGNIVFLNQEDTLILNGGGDITLKANFNSSDKGYSGAIVLRSPPD